MTLAKIVFSSLEYSMQSFDFFDDFTFFSLDSIATVNPGRCFIEVRIEKTDLDYQIFSFTKEIFDKKKHTDTIEIPKIFEKLRYTGQYAHLSLGYYKCELLCDGYVNDYYNNGKIRFEGDFKNGIPIDETKKHDIDGKLVQIEIYDKDETLKETKYPE
ncbi:MAG: hypothetical protein ACI83H_001861 [Glaciecola sp.]|jgi:hypothetical protein